MSDARTRNAALVRDIHSSFYVMGPGMVMSSKEWVAYLGYVARMAAAKTAFIGAAAYGVKDYGAKDFKYDEDEA